MADAGRRSCSSTGSGCTRARGAPGSTCSRRTATSRRHPAGPATPTRSRRRGGTPTASPASGSTPSSTTTPRRSARSRRSRSRSATPSAASSSSGSSARTSPRPRSRSTRRRSRACSRCRRRRSRSPRSRCAARRTSSKAVSLTREQFRYGFGNALSEQESNELFEQLDDPVAGPAALRGRVRGVLAALPGEGRHEELDPRPAARHRRRQGPHRPARDQPLDGQALPPLDRGHRPSGVPGPRPLADDRQRLARRRGRRPRTG